MSVIWWLREAAMGRGGYSGGSSLVGANGYWSSYDPADNKTRSAGRGAKRAKSVAKPPVARNEKSVLGDIVFGLAAGKGVSSKNIPTELLREIKLAGGAIEWAKRQPRFDYLLERASQTVAKQTAAKTLKKQRLALRRAAKKQATPNPDPVPHHELQRQKWLSDIGIDLDRSTPFFEIACRRIALNSFSGQPAVKVAAMFNQAGFKTASGGLWTRRLVLILRDRMTVVRR